MELGKLYRFNDSGNVVRNVRGKVFKIISLGFNNACSFEVYDSDGSIIQGFKNTLFWNGTVDFLSKNSVPTEPIVIPTYEGSILKFNFITCLK